jgi:EAL domain-containing protein (putative c-di-GMP-specific phosphodiesterase class I)
MLTQLRNLGVGLSIDDFGTGYSSLSYLHRFPIDTLKIDRSFVTRMTDNSENAEIVRTIVTLARSLDMDIIAEGVETHEQLRQLSSLGCDYGQGYLFAKPVAGGQAIELLLKGGFTKLLSGGEASERILAA